jgi:hypothetical protein
MSAGPLVRTLTAVTAAMAAAELISAVIIWREAYPDSQPLFALAFAALYVLATWLLRSHRVVVGAVLAGLLCLFEVATAPTWQRYSALDWSTQIVFAAISLIGVVVAAAVLVTRFRSARTDVRAR